MAIHFLSPHFFLSFFFFLSRNQSSFSFFLASSSLLLLLLHRPHLFLSLIGTIFFISFLLRSLTSYHNPTTFKLLGVEIWPSKLGSVRVVSGNLSFGKRNGAMI